MLRMIHQPTEDIYLPSMKRSCRQWMNAECFGNNNNNDNSNIGAHNNKCILYSSERRWTIELILTDSYGGWELLCYLEWEFIGWISTQVFIVYYFCFFFRFPFVHYKIQFHSFGPEIHFSLAHCVHFSLWKKKLCVKVPCFHRLNGIRSNILESI